MRIANILLIASLQADSSYGKSRKKALTLQPL